MNAKQALAPTGKLRAGMNIGNNLFTRQNEAGGLYGVSVDLMQELASSLDVPLELVVYDQPGQVADDAGNDKWDVAILAIEQTRAKTILFSPPMTEIEAGYIVLQQSTFQVAAEVDSNGIKIAAPAKAGYELYLSNHLKNASIVHSKNFANSLEMFNQQEVDAVAGLKPNLIESMHLVPMGRLLNGNFMTVNHGFSVPLGKGDSAAYLEKFVKELIAKDFIGSSILKHQIKGLIAVQA
ncbi:MAG: transporter substrate-binding domain-containing protein [Burkholderiales bacterium]|nr:transporter substrate-binding domain-containing protein [Burkholderiales bacterium]